MALRLKALVSVLSAAVLLAPGCGQLETAPVAVEPARPDPLEIQQRLIADGNVTVVKFPNGLTAIVKPTSHAPVVCVRAYVRAGGLYEGEWLGAGISHLTEHLVAKGAVHDMPGATDKSVTQTTGRVKEIGGQSNAYTSLDHTCYYMSAAAGKANDCIDLIADWMTRPEITDADFAREHGVVQRELETGSDDPDRQMWRTHMANFFATHPAGVPVIGFTEPLASLTRQDVLDYHRRMYVPQNMVLAVVGDVRVEAALDRLKRALAGFEPGFAPDLSLPDVSPVTGVRRVVRAHKDLKDVTERISFRTIPLVHEDLYALDVLSYVLTQGRASRLVQTIQREQKLVTSIQSSSWTPAWGAGMFTLAYRAEPGKADEAEKQILAELAAIVADGVEADELDRAKRQKTADFVYSQQTAESIAATLASDYLSAGDVNFSKHYTDRIQAVTAENVQAAARKYFTFDAMVITRLDPARPAEAPAAATTQPADAARPRTSMFTLANGLRVVLHPTDAVGLVSMAFVTRGGVLLEAEETNGLGALMTGLSTKGAAGRSAEEIARFFDRAGGGVSGNCGNNSFYWQATVLDDSFDEAIAIFADIVIRPDCTAKELDILRPVLLERIRRQDERWQSQLQKFFRSKFFEQSPYRMLPIGSQQAVSGATPEQISAHHAANVLAGSSVLAVFGNFDADKTTQRITELFAGLPPGSVDMPLPARRAVCSSGEDHALDTQNQVAGIMVAAPGMQITDIEDRIAIDVLDTIISGWRLPEGWLHGELRGKQLVYVVHAYNWVGLAPGAFAVYAACQPAKAGEVVQIIQTSLDRASTYLPTPQEVNLAVNSILTAELLDNQEMSALAMSAALDELYELGYDFRSKLERLYRQATPQEVLRVGRKYLGRGYVTTVTKPAAAPAKANDKTTSGGGG